jgi:hypothetical protein
MLKNICSDIDIDTSRKSGCNLFAPGPGSCPEGGFLLCVKVEDQIEIRALLPKDGSEAFGKDWERSRSENIQRTVFKKTVPEGGMDLDYPSTHCSACASKGKLKRCVQYCIYLI